MELSLDTVIAILSLLIGGGGGAFFTWRYQAKKAKAEACSAEASAAKELQDVYQQLINDVKADRDEQKAYIGELKEDRKHLRGERDELRQRQDSLEQVVRDLQRDVARNGRIVEAMRPFLCGRANCKDRQFVTISESGEVERSRRKKKDIDPVDSDVL